MATITSDLETHILDQIMPKIHEVTFQMESMKSRIRYRYALSSMNSLRCFHEFDPNNPHRPEFFEELDNQWQITLNTESKPVRLNQVRVRLK